MIRSLFRWIRFVNSIDDQIVNSITTHRNVTTLMDFMNAHVVFDEYHENCYVIADSNHGYKMLGVGKLVAGTIMGEKSKLLEPFRFSRFEEGKLHPVSNSPFPWS